jgi:2-phosphosulfolactate phosphatase
MPVLSTLKDRVRVTRHIVVLDIFRASNTIIELLARGAERVVTLRDEADALTLKTLHPDWMLVGERNGVRIPGFDADNSPTALPARLDGKGAIMTTSNGTRILDACGPECEVLIGSFANASALIAYLRADGADDPSFWAVGTVGDVPAVEDEVCARYLDALFHGRPMDFTKARTQALAGDGGDRLRRLGLDDDLALCVELDRTTLVPHRVPWHGQYSLVAAPVAR